MRFPSASFTQKQNEKKKIYLKKVIFLRSWIVIHSTQTTCATPHTSLELSRGPKGRRAEPHNYRARIEIKKTMRLSFYGHRG